MHDCVPLGTGNSRFLKSSIPADATWEQARELFRKGLFPTDIGPVNEAGVAQKGDPLNQETLLKTAVAALYGKDGAAVPSDIFEILSKAALYEHGVIKDVLGASSVKPGNCDIFITSYIGTGQKSTTITFPKALKALFLLGNPNSDQGNQHQLGIYVAGFQYMFCMFNYGSSIAKSIPESLSNGDKTFVIDTGIYGNASDAFNSNNFLFRVIGFLQ